MLHAMATDQPSWCLAGKLQHVHALFSARYFAETVPRPQASQAQLASLSNYAEDAA